MKQTLVVCLLLVATGAAQAQNWPSFRGENGRGVADGHAAPVVWNVEKRENILWSVPIPGLSVASPIVWNDRVFVVSAESSDAAAEKYEPRKYGHASPHPDQSEHAWKVYALDRRTGKVIWESVAHRGVPKSKRHAKSSQANSTPATDGKYVVAFFGSEGLYAYDWNGKLAWKRDLGVFNAGSYQNASDEWGSASSPIIYKNMVIVQADLQKDSFLAAFDLKTGKDIWRVNRDEMPSWGTPAIFEHADGRAEVITHASKFIRSYDVKTGKELWRLGPNSSITATTPAVAGGMVFVSNGYFELQPIYAIKPGGKGDLTLPEGQSKSDFIAWSTKRGGAQYPSPLVYDGLYYVLGGNGVLTVYRAADGELVYQRRIGSGGAYTASAIAGDGKLYFFSEDGDAYVLKAGEKYELLAKNPVGDVILATPALSNGVLFIRGIKNLVAVRLPG